MFKIGIDVTRVTAAAEFTLGTLGAVVTTAGSKIYMYVKAGSGGITGDGYIVNIDGSSFVADMITTTTTAPGTGAGKACAVARAAFTAAYYGWVQVYGAGTFRTLASCAAYTLVNSTATAGAVDDDASAGAEVIAGLTLDTATGGAEANTAGWINWPRVDRTLA